jgi:hypothetical protein
MNRPTVGEGFGKQTTEQKLRIIGNLEFKSERLAIPQLGGSFFLVEN